MSFSRCLTCSGPLNSRTVSKPSRPLALVANGKLCQAESCSILTQLAHAFEKPQVEYPASFSFFASSNTSGHVFGISAMLAFFNASRLTHITVEEELNGNESISPLEVE